MAERFKIPRKCKKCGNDFVGRDKGGIIAKYCSRKCHFRDINIGEHQIKAGRAGVLYQINRRGTGIKGYIKELGVNQHRVVMEKYIGRKLTKDEIIHHIDENKHNNSIENLQIVTKAQHARIHFTSPSKKNIGSKSKKNIT